MSACVAASVAIDTDTSRFWRAACSACVSVSVCTGCAGRPDGCAGSVDWNGGIGVCTGGCADRLDGSAGWV